MMVRLVYIQQKAEENFSVRRRKTKPGDTSKIVVNSSNSFPNVRGKIHPNIFLFAFT